jgi:hypothetical protein
MKTERNQGRSREEARARSVPDAKTGSSHIDKTTRNKGRSLKEEYERGIADAKAGVFRPNNPHDVVEGYVIVGSSGVKVYSHPIPGAVTSSSKTVIAESYPIGDIIIDDDLADDIASMMERLEKGIAAENEALENLRYRMATA